MAGSGKAHLREGADPIVRVDNLVVEYDLGAGRKLHAVSDVSLDLLPGEALGIVGESGCGKSTLAKAIVQLQPARSGSVRFEGVELTALAGRRLRQARRRLQMIFQDPISSLNPRRRVEAIILEGLSIWRRGARNTRRERARAMIADVGLDPGSMADRRPRQLSGGQCQRVSIARALILDPTVLVCDEAVSALDVSVQAQILNLLEDMKDRHNLSLVFISHDLAVVKNISDRVLVMYLGKICEVGPADQLFHAPVHPYTRLLLDSLPGNAGHGGSLALDSEELPSPLNPPSGCRFRTRCPHARPLCAQQEPELRAVAEGQFAACHFVAEFPAAAPSPRLAQEPQ